MADKTNSNIPEMRNALICKEIQKYIDISCFVWLSKHKSDARSKSPCWLYHDQILCQTTREENNEEKHNSNQEVSNQLEQDQQNQALISHIFIEIPKYTIEEKLLKFQNIQ